jgi:hypothetical protein
VGREIGEDREGLGAEHETLLAAPELVDSGQSKEDSTDEPGCMRRTLDISSSLDTESTENPADSTPYASSTGDYARVRRLGLKRDRPGETMRVD